VVCPVRTFYGQWGREFFRCGRRIFGAKKTRIFRNLWCDRTDLSSANKGVNFSRFCVDVFYGRPLQTSGSRELQSTLKILIVILYTKRKTYICFDYWWRIFSRRKPKKYFWIGGEITQNFQCSAVPQINSTIVLKRKIRTIIWQYENVTKRKSTHSMKNAKLLSFEAICIHLYLSDFSYTNVKKDIWLNFYGSSLPNTLPPTKIPSLIGTKLEHGQKMQIFAK